MPVHLPLLPLFTIRQQKSVKLRRIAGSAQVAAHFRNTRPTSANARTGVRPIPTRRTPNRKCCKSMLQSRLRSLRLRQQKDQLQLHRFRIRSETEASASATINPSTPPTAPLIRGEINTRRISTRITPGLSAFAFSMITSVRTVLCRHLTFIICTLILKSIFGKFSVVLRAVL